VVEVKLFEFQLS